jgi:DNA-binding XRE family transcriptional regulator
VCWAAGGPQQYSGRPMGDSHRHLMITPSEWESFMDDLQQTLEKFTVPLPEQQELRAIVESTREAIVIAPLAPLRDGWSRAQIRKARELLGWRQAELAKQARIPTHSVESAENSHSESFVPGRVPPAIQAALESAGVEFTNGDDPGVKLKPKAKGKRG